MNQVAIDAIEFLESQEIPKFVDLIRREVIVLPSVTEVVSTLHMYGINIRYLGLIFSLLCEGDVLNCRETFLSIYFEMVFRVIEKDICCSSSSPGTLYDPN